MAKQTILLGSALYQLDRPRAWPSEYSDDAYNYSHSMALVCPRCLAQWAILSFEGETDLHPQGAYCERHGDGRLLLHHGPVDLPLLNALPEVLLRREFRLTLQHLDQTGA